MQMVFYTQKLYGNIVKMQKPKRKMKSLLTHTHWVKNKQRRMGHTWQVLVEKRTRAMKGEEKREEGEVFTLRVLIHYRTAEARSVTLSHCVYAGKTAFQSNSLSFLFLHPSSLFSLLPVSSPIHPH